MKSKLARDIYVLHIALPTGECTHYVGSTKPKRFPIRLREHQRGRGAHTTNTLTKLGAVITGTVIARNQSPIEEYLLQLHAAEICPQCNFIPQSKASQASHSARKSLTFLKTYEIPAL